MGVAASNPSVCRDGNGRYLALRPADRHRQPQKESDMKVIRMVFLTMAVLLPTSWTLAHAGDDMKDKDGEMKKGKKKKDKGDMGGEKGDMDKKKGDMEKK